MRGRAENRREILNVRVPKIYILKIPFAGVGIMRLTNSWGHTGSQSKLRGIIGGDDIS